MPTARRNAPSKIGARLTELRESRGLSQSEVSRRTGIHRPNISRLEGGKWGMTLDTLATMARGLECRVVDIVCVLDEDEAAE
jgi:transcriptional regulator with XRE-family HTH domain